MDSNEENYIATAFISCSLRQDDKPFIEFIERILKHHKIEPIGTVGRFSASPQNTAELMKENIPKADFVVIVATPRYIQKDIMTGEESYGVSEMVHVETGMAYMANKPVVVFVQEGTQVGNFLPKITQYITLNGTEHNLNSNWGLINSLLQSTYHFVRQTQDKEANETFFKALRTGLALVGGYQVIKFLVSDDSDDYYDDEI